MNRLYAIALVVADQAASSIFNFALMVLVARNFNIEQVGVFSLAWAVAFFLYSIAEGLIFNPLAKLSSFESFSKEDVIGFSFFSCVVLVVCFSALLLIVGSTLDGVWREAIFLTVAIFPGITLGYFLRRVLIVAGKVLVSILLIVLQAIIFFGVFYLLRDVLTIVSLSLLWSGVVFAVGLIWYIDFFRKAYMLGVQECGAGFRLLWQYGRWNLLALTPVSLSGFLIAPLVMQLQGVSGVAILRGLQSLTSPLHQAQGAIYGFYLSRTQATGTNIFAPVVCLALAFMAFLALVFFPFDIITLAFGAEFPGANVMPYFALAMLVESIVQFFCFRVQVMGDYKIIPVVRIGGVLGLAVAILFTWLYGLSLLKYGSIAVAVGCLIPCVIYMGRVKAV